MWAGSRHVKQTPIIQDSNPNFIIILGTVWGKVLGMVGVGGAVGRMVGETSGGMAKGTVGGMVSLAPRQTPNYTWYTPIISSIWAVW